MPIHRLFGLSVLSLFLLAPSVWAQTLTFVDASGAPAGAYLENTRVHVRVEDAAGNSAPWILDTMDVALVTALGGDFEFLRLTETGADTGVFEGSMNLAQSAPAFPNGTLETAVQAGPPVVRDTLTVEYVPFYAPSITATAGMVGARIQFLDDSGQPAAGYTQGDWITVRVEDHVLAGSATAVVTALFAGDDELLNLQETGNATGIYEGRIQASLHLGSDGDGVVGSPPGSPVHGRYTVTDAPETVTAETQLVGSRAEILNAAGEPADFVAESSTIRLRVVDRLADDPERIDTVQAAVSSAIGLDEETVTLHETGPGSGVFESELPTSIDSTIPGNGRLETAEDAGPPHRFDTITLAYGSSSDTAATYGSETLFLDGFGNDAPSYAAGTAVHLRVIDHNRDQSAARDTVTATVMSLMTGDSETLTLAETGEHTAVFEGSLPLGHPFFAGGSPGDGELQAQIGDTVEARHTDALGNTASGDRAAIRFAHVEIFDEQGRPTGEVLEGGLVHIRAYDVLANFDSFTADTFYLTVRSGLNPDYEMPQLTETGPDTGIFEGSIRLAFSTEFSPNGILATTNSGPPSYEQDTVTVEHFDVQARATTVGARIQMIDRFGADAERFALGDLVGVRVEDHNADIDPLSRQTLQVTVLGNNEEEQVSVLETGNATGVFEGSIPTRLAYENPTSSNGTLEVYGYHRFEARHPWAHSPRFATDFALTGQSAVRFVDAQGRPVESYLEATVAWVWLISAADNSPFTVDTATVTVSAAISQDGESLALTETGPDTGIFMGSIPLRADAPLSGDGLLQTGRSADGLDTLTVTHGPPYDQASDTAAITGSRLWFVDAYGNLTDDYARGSRAYVRVEDHALVDTAEVTLRSLVTGDEEILTLQETAPASGIFEGSLPLDASGFFPFPSDGRLQSNGGDEIEAVHTGFSGAPPSSDRARITYGSVDFVDETGEITFEVLENGVARLRVFEAYDSDPFYNFVYVTVRTLYGNDSEPLMLTETAEGSLVYEGTIQLATVPPGTGFGFNFLLETSNGPDGPEQLTAEFFDDVARATVVSVPSNTAPVAADDEAATAEDQAVNITVLANDSDAEGDPLTVTVESTTTTHGTITVETDNTITYTPNPNFHGTDSFAYLATDPQGLNDLATVTITVAPVNDPPVAAADSAITLAETPVTIDVRANDADIDSPALTITTVTQGAHGSVAIDAGQTVTYIPAAEWIGPDTFTYTISDGAGGTATATVSVDVQAPPRVSSGIQVLYTFEEGSGTTVHDVSGVGTPLDLTVGDPADVSWLPGALSIDDATLVESTGAATKVINACKSSNEVTVEAWVLPANLSQTGPAAIVTLSHNVNKRNVTLGQSGTAYNGQLRTSSTNKEGSQLDAGGMAALGLSHVVYTRSSTGATRIYVNGTEAASGTLSGTFSTWESFSLALGGELAGPRYWTGDLHLVAIYSRALTGSEVRQNFLAGAN